MALFLWNSEKKFLLEIENINENIRYSTVTEIIRICNLI